MFVIGVFASIDLKVAKWVESKFAGLERYPQYCTVVVKMIRKCYYVRKYIA